MYRKIFKRTGKQAQVKLSFIICEMITCFIFFTMLSSCASTSKPRPPADYSFTKDLKSVDKISTFKIDSWEPVDTRSIILKTDFNKYYLLVLDRPMSMILTQHTLGISSTVTSIAAGFDRVFVNDNGVTKHYTIDKIYKLEGRKQAKEIRDMLRGK